MFKPTFTVTNKINNSLLEIERARGFLKAAKLRNIDSIARPYYKISLQQYCDIYCDKWQRLKILRPWMIGKD